MKKWKFWCGYLANTKYHWIMMLFKKRLKLWYYWKHSIKCIFKKSKNCLFVLLSLPILFNNILPIFIFLTTSSCKELSHSITINISSIWLISILIYSWSHTLFMNPERNQKNEDFWLKIEMSVNLRKLMKEIIREWGTKINEGSLLIFKPFIFLKKISLMEHFGWWRDNYLLV